jgi:hypothetical protein
MQEKFWHPTKSTHPKQVMSQYVELYLEQDRVFKAQTTRCRQKTDMSQPIPLHDISLTSHIFKYCALKTERSTGMTPEDQRRNVIIWWIGTASNDFRELSVRFQSSQGCWTPLQRYIWFHVAMSRRRWETGLMCRIWATTSCVEIFCESFYARWMCEEYVELNVKLVLFFIVTH